MLKRFLATKIAPNAGMHSKRAGWNRSAAAALIALPLYWASGGWAPAAPVDPATLNPYVHLDANRGVVSEGVDTTATAWKDQSANGFLFQSNHPNADSNDPTLRSGRNGTLAIEFDGSDIIDSDSLLELFTTDASALTVFTVMSPADLPGNQQFLINHAPGVGGDSFELGPDAGQVQSPGAWGIHRGSSQATSTGPDTLTAGDYYIMTTEVNTVGAGGSNVAFFRNGAHQPNASGGWLSPGNYTTGSDPIKVFSRVDANGRFYSAQMSAVPEPLAIQSIEVNAEMTTVTLTWNSRPGRSYTLESSESVATQTWLEIDDGIPSGAPTSTTFTHNLLDSYPDGAPPTLYYRLAQN